MAKVAGRFARVEPRATAREFGVGLLSDVEQKNCWSLASAVGTGVPTLCNGSCARPAGTPTRSATSLRGLGMAPLGDPDGALIVDETGLLKKGEHSAGVQRQYSGSVGWRGARPEPQRRKHAAYRGPVRGRRGLGALGVCGAVPVCRPPVRRDQLHSVLPRPPRTSSVPSLRSAVTPACRNSAGSAQ
ncbi:transposase [Streptomyces sp. WAC05292]|uniref:transposase n=1 Tax=Streptomyces sp. WAC05292 TaxID=2487418 RepID=UPI0037DDB1D0